MKASPQFFRALRDPEVKKFAKLSSGRQCFPHRAGQSCDFFPR